MYEFLEQGDFCPCSRIQMWGTGDISEPGEANEVEKVIPTVQDNLL